jgi:hypothetical protein
MKRHLWYCLLLLLIGTGLVLSGCGDDDDNPVNPNPPVDEWEILIQDPDEGDPANLDTLSVLVTDSSVIFRLDTHGAWADPYDPDGGVNAAIFVDTDTDVSTGLSSTSGYAYHPNDIGADLAIIVGVEGDSLFRWDPGNNAWANPAELSSLMLVADTSRFEVELNYSLIGYPDKLDIVAATVCWIDFEANYDFGPDQGHATLDLGTQIVSTDNPLAARPVRDLHKPPGSAWRR